MPLFGHGNPGTWEYGRLFITLEWEREGGRERERRELILSASSSRAAVRHGGSAAEGDAARMGKHLCGWNKRKTADARFFFLGQHRCGAPARCRIPRPQRQSGRRAAGRLCCRCVRRRLNVTLLRAAALPLLARRCKRELTRQHLDQHHAERPPVDRLEQRDDCTTPGHPCWETGEEELLPTAFESWRPLSSLSSTL